MDVARADALVGADPEHDRAALHPAAGGDQVLVRVDVERLLERHLEQLVTAVTIWRPSRRASAANQLDAPGLAHHGVVGVLAVHALVEQGPGLGALLGLESQKRCGSRTQEDSESALLARNRSTAPRIVGAD